MVIFSRNHQPRRTRLPPCFMLMQRGFVRCNFIGHHVWNGQESTNQLRQHISHMKPCICCFIVWCRSTLCWNDVPKIELYDRILKFPSVLTTPPPILEIKLLGSGSITKVIFWASNTWKITDQREILIPANLWSIWTMLCWWFFCVFANNISKIFKPNHFCEFVLNRVCPSSMRLSSRCSMANVFSLVESNAVKAIEQ